MGVEEEFHLVDLGSRHSIGAADRVLHAVGRDDDIVPELKASVVESNSGVFTDLDDLRDDLARLRRELIDAARSVDVGVLASGSAPLVGAAATAAYPKDRYREMSERYAPTARQQVVCGVQTQVGIDDRDDAVRVVNAALAWSPVLLAMSASSPYWFGEDTDYASYRTRVWDRWPSSGPPTAFRDAAQYDEVVAALLDTEVVLDVGMVYFDIRLSAHQPTVEFRACDSTSRLDDVVAFAALWRALAATLLAGDAASLPPAASRVEVLRASRWQAARYGLGERLIDPVGGRPVPAADAVARLLDLVRPALDEAGDTERVDACIEELLRTGTSAQRQRERFAATESLTDVVEQIRRETAAL